MKINTWGVITLAKEVFMDHLHANKSIPRAQIKMNLLHSMIISKAIWTRYFLELQGYKVHDSVLHQDN